jgi:hypothetical protein
MRTSFILAGLLALGVTTGCSARGTVGATASYSTPEMVYVSPGVHVVADYDRPVFYTNGYYWLYSGGVWMRSHRHNHGFVRVRSVPYAVRRIDRPHRYVRVRARHQRGQPARVHRQRGRR